MDTDIVRDTAGALILFVISLLFFLGMGWMLQGDLKPGTRVLADSPVTPTPFQPQTVLPTSIPAFNRTGPLAAVDFSHLDNPSAPAPVPEIPMSPDTLNVLLTGSDTRPGFPGNRTDTIMILSFNMDAGSVSMISIPRDLYVYLPGHGMARINTAEGRAGIRLLADTLRYNLGITTHHSVRINFEGFISAVDTLGGIDIMNERRIVDTCDLQPVEYPAGLQHLDGTSALCYARVRKTTSDFDRMRRQQQIIDAVFEKAVTLHGLASAPELYSSYAEYVETDLTMDAVLQLLPLAVHVVNHPEDIHHYTIAREHVQTHTVPDTGAMVLLPVHDAIQLLLEEAFSLQ